MCSLCRFAVAKNHNFGQILTSGGLLYRPPFTDESQIWCAIADPQCTFTFQDTSRSVYPVALWRRKKPQFLPIFSALSDVDNWQQSKKVEHGCTTTNTNLPLFNGIKIVSVLQCIHGETGHTNSDIQKRDVTKSVTDRQKIQRLSPPRRRVKSDPHRTWHGDRGPRTRSYTSKTFGV